jgi:hypothetical protein
MTNILLDLKFVLIVAQLVELARERVNYFLFRYHIVYSILYSGKHKLTMTSYDYRSAEFYEYMDSDYMKEIVICDCGSSIQRRNTNKHFKTVRHQEYENDNNIINKIIGCKSCMKSYKWKDRDEHYKSKHLSKCIQTKSDNYSFRILFIVINEIIQLFNF